MPEPTIAGKTGTPSTFGPTEPMTDSPIQAPTIPTKAPAKKPLRPMPGTTREAIPAQTAETSRKRKK